MLSDVRTIDNTDGENEVDKTVGIDVGYVNSDLNDKVYNEDSEMSRYLPTNINRRKEKELIDDEFLKPPEKHKWHIASEPLN
jgi:hypothetical protein